METFTVRLHRVTKDDPQYALDLMEEIFNEYDVPDDDKPTISRMRSNHFVLSGDPTDAGLCRVRSGPMSVRHLRAKRVFARNFVPHDTRRLANCNDLSHYWRRRRMPIMSDPHAATSMDAGSGMAAFLCADAPVPPLQLRAPMRCPNPREPTFHNPS